MGFIVRIIDEPRLPTAWRSKPVYVRCKLDRYGGWGTIEPGDAKIWKTRRGAQRWLDERAWCRGEVVER